MLAFTMLWAYMSFSQFLIIWSGNLAEEIPWYLGGRRRLAVRGAVADRLPLLRAVLLPAGPREQAESPTALAVAAALVIHFVNDAWLSCPPSARRAALKLLALAPASLGVGGPLGRGVRPEPGSRPLVPRNDPQLADVLEHAHHAGGH